MHTLRLVPLVILSTIQPISSPSPLFVCLLALSCPVAWNANLSDSKLEGGSIHSTWIFDSCPSRSIYKLLFFQTKSSCLLLPHTCRHSRVHQTRRDDTLLVEYLLPRR
ncbi:uncharacterized protein EDB91DRAFT_192696 [Suillus paluster]|uniref:uncharacterized protein n=1 Tax=Suillus paluster TaxID=48578 RepID=UPI001B871FA3|nr:uncharacterized protein EDB91DRAFT_192696 [Suillus paluster]KAG1744594.1 hypothetical protein EDB91DRAFT_192696 [Suillus paluster]